MESSAALASALTRSPFIFDPMTTSDSPTYFLVGARRTGSTLLRVMLDSHPRIRFVRHWAVEMGLDYINEEGVAATNLEQYYWKLAGSYAFRESCIVIDRSLALPECLRDVLVQLQRSSSKPILGGAVHRNFPRLLFVCPDARFIYLYRDGRDVARSRMATGVARNYWTAAEPWMTAEDQAKKMRSDLPEGRWLEIRYEDLILRTRQTLTRICEFMGASYDDAIFEYMKRTRYTAPDPKLVDQWRHKMSPFEMIRHSRDSP